MSETHLMLQEDFEITHREPPQRSVSYDVVAEVAAARVAAVAERTADARRESISSSAAVEFPSDTARKMIRTANIQFRVKDVIQTTFEIENLVVRRNGFVENTRLASQINREREIPIKSDSALLVTHYTVSNTLILRVPNTELDATLREIAQFVEFMDHRTINAQDITLDLLSTRLEQERLARFDNRMTRAIDNQGRRLDNISDAENLLLQRQRQADEATLARLRLLDRVDFSTITLFLYQNQSIRYETVAREKVIRPYSHSAPFGTRFVDALKSGWNIVVEIFLFLVNIWSIILIGVLVFFVARYFKEKFTKRRIERNNL
jgi:hypothetical protein